MSSINALNNASTDSRQSLRIGVYPDSLLTGAFLGPAHHFFGLINPMLTYVLTHVNDNMTKRTVPAVTSVQSSLSSCGDYTISIHLGVEPDNIKIN